LKKNVLGRTGLEVTELSLGTLILGRIQANLSIEDGAKPVARAMELGINLIDTAASYGSQPHVREGLKGFLEEVLITTKSHGRTRETVQKDFETSLKELGRDYIDIYQLHLVNNAKEMEERRDVVKFLLELKQQKLIRAIGASVHRVEGAKAVAAEKDIDILFPVLNSHGLGIIDGTIDEMIAVCRQAKERGMGIMAMKPLGGGHLRKSPRESFDFLRGLGFVSSTGRPRSPVSPAGRTNPSPTARTPKPGAAAPVAASGAVCYNAGRCASAPGRPLAPGRAGTLLRGGAVWRLRASCSLSPGRRASGRAR
jgi:aryl-alcohol dehydrogenase-like predicted oxidoreductase